MKGCLSIFERFAHVDEVGGPLAESTKDKWAPGQHSAASLTPRKVLDQATELYFKYDSAAQKTPGAAAWPF